MAHGLEIPLRYGVRQTYAENGGLGGFAHAARNIRPVLEIAHDMERLCPAAWFLKITNPMVRICDAIARYSRIKAVGLCHQIKAGYAMVGLVLADHLGFIVPAGFTDTHASPASIPPRIQVIRQALELVDIKAAGLNHFTWMLDLRDKRTGGDLYPLFAERWACFPYLARGAIVEVPGLAAGSGVHGLGVGALPEPVAELCRREITVGQLCVDAAVQGDRQAALQCLLLDPVVTDLDVAQQILDDYLTTYREHLPQFWDG